ncbi:hypothetical protein EDB87DRAFT_1782634 [Lactarius vividus]|nr:hypothetical protein EDB87DRAFT_1782634 [Lactarius vividus]
MVDLNKPNVDVEQDMSDTSTLPDTTDAYESIPLKIRGAPTNHLLVSKKGVAIEGKYFIDLSITPPPQSVSDVVAGAKNLSLYTTSGSVTADIWVTGNNKVKQVSVKLCSDNGRVRAKIHDVFADNGSEHRPSFDIDLQAKYGDISLSLPRCFRGPITIRSSHERINFSPALEERTAPISDVQGVRVYFIGDRPRSGQWRSDDDKEGELGAGAAPEEPLDELSVGGWHTSVRINWDGEPELPQMNQNGWENFCMGSARFFTSGRVN